MPSLNFVRSYVLGLVVLAAFGCGQKPSFVDKKDTSKSEDASVGVGQSGHIDETGSTDGHGHGDDDGGSDVGPTGKDDGQDDGTTDGKDDGTSDGTGDTDGNDGAIHKVKSFPGELLGDGQVTANLADPFLTQDITLKRSYGPTNSNFTQIARPAVDDNFVQGNAGTPYTETFNQATAKPLDLLVVIDNSRSMAEEQINLSQRLLPLLSYINDSDWRIGVVTTDTADGCLRKLIKKTDTNPMGAFADAITAGIAGDGNERGVLQAVNALQCVQTPWLRSDSSLAILIVSDEDNCSDGLGCGTAPYSKKEYLLDYLKQIRVPGANARIYGLFWHPTQAQSACSTALNKASIYSSLVTDTNGAWGSICDADYSTTLSAISKNISTIVDRRFTLQRAPDAGSAQVFIDNVLQTTGYSLMDSVLIFDSAPIAGSVVRIAYTVGSLPIKTKFSLSSMPLDPVFTVTFDGTLIASTTYTYDMASNSVTFLTPPPSGAKIKIGYTKNVALNNRFDLGRTYDRSTLRVYVNNFETKDFDADPAINNVVTLKDFPPDGAIIHITYTGARDPILLYPFVVNGQAAQNLTLADSVTGAPVGFAYVFGVIKINAGEFVEGRHILARYSNEGRNYTEVELPSAPVTGSVSVKGGGIDCPATKFTVTNSHVSVANCAFPASVTSLVVAYKYAVESYTRFVFDDPELANVKSPLTWKVWINGVKTKDFTVESGTIVLSSPLPLVVGNVVKIEVSYVP